MPIIGFRRGPHSHDHFTVLSAAGPANKFTYYEDQKGDRKIECDKAVDPVFYWATMRRERLRARQEEYRKERREQFSGKDLREIDQILLEECGMLSSPEISPETSPVELVTMSSSTATLSIESSRAKKRKLYKETEEEEEETSDFPHTSRTSGPARGRSEMRFTPLLPP